MINTKPVTLEMLKKLASTDSISRTKQLSTLLDDRLCEIISKMTSLFKKTNYWWSWKWYEGEYTPPPPFNYEENVEDDSTLCYYLSTGRMIIIDKNNQELNLGEACPLRWLWEDFEQELTAGKAKKQLKDEQERNTTTQKQKELKDIKSQYIQSAMKKLTPEEIWACGLGKLPKSLRQYRDVQ